MNDISKFNNQYLKCIITKYDSTVNSVNGYLANSGALIVYHPDNENETYTTIVNGKEKNTEYNRNYIYLGNEFLASGYGFLCKDMRDDAEQIVKTYKETLNNLNKADALESQNRINADNDILNKLQNYVKTEGGIINDTYVNINGNLIKTKDVLFYGEEAKYENLEITNVNLKVWADNQSYELNGNNIYLPLGIIINSIEVDIEYDVKDSGGISKLEVYHKPSSNIDAEAVIIKYDLDDNGNNTEGIIKYKKIFENDERLYANDIIENFISGFNIYVKETPISKYKNYPKLKEYFNVDIKSSGNKITNNVIQLFKHINIIPQYSIHYVFSDNVSLSSDDYPSFILTYKLLTNINNEIILDVNKTKHNLYLAIPSNYRLNSLYAISNNIKYNWTGSLLIANDDNNIKIISYKNNDSVDSFDINYKLYKLRNGNNNQNSKFICDKIVLNISLIDNNNDIMRANNNYGVPNFDNIITVNDEEFNNLYWVSFEGNESKTIIDYTLKPLIKNGSSNNI